jgi:hypothetical protein
MAENDAQHVKLAVACALSGHDRGRILLQQIGKRVRAEHASINGQLTAIKLGFPLACPLLGVSLEPESP